jgi:hypothetical protein
MRQLEQQRTVSGNSPETLTFPESAAQTFEVGSPVVLSASGTVQEAASPAASVVGVAAVNASGVTGRGAQVWIANDDTLFGVVMPAATQATIGTAVQITKTGGRWSAVVGAGGSFLVMEIGQSLPPGQVIVRGKFLEANTQLAKTA